MADPQQQPAGEHGLKRGDVITVRDWEGQLLQRRVWSQVGAGVQVCSESEYRRAIETGDEPLYVGFPLTDVVV